MRVEETRCNDEWGEAGIFIFPLLPYSWNFGDICSRTNPHHLRQLKIKRRKCRHLVAARVRARPLARRALPREMRASREVGVFLEKSLSSGGSSEINVAWLPRSGNRADTAKYKQKGTGKIYSWFPSIHKLSTKHSTIAKVHTIWSVKNFYIWLGLHGL